MVKINNVKYPDNTESHVAGSRLSASDDTGRTSDQPILLNKADVNALDSFNPVLTNALSHEPATNMNIRESYVDTLAEKRKQE